ncbi:MAG TPA: phosphotransferase family protein [Stellaceae bacterium]|nr:phosphotransferase family protein [Stellaceae bacterium]
MNAGDGETRRRLAGVIARATGATAATIVAMEPVAGGAVRRHSRLMGDIDGASLDLVLRTGGETALGLGLDLADEFTLLRFLHGERLAVPEPILYCGDPAAIGAPFHLTRTVAGSADPTPLVAAAADDGLAERLGRMLASIHGIVPSPAALAFLGPPPADPARERLAEFRRLLDAVDEARPAAEWGMRALLLRAPPPASAVLCHGDFRTGNYLVAAGRPTAVLDWEFAQWGDPDEDLGWFCSRCWRFGAYDREAGGIGTRAAFERGYAAASGRRLDPERVHYWEAMAALKWLVIALLQRNRFLVQGERSLDLALTGRRAAECEFELLRLTELW